MKTKKRRDLFDLDYVPFIRNPFLYVIQVKNKVKLADSFI